jgi:hypothetical protein
MTSAGSLLLIAVGAILRYAVTASVSGVNLQTVGTILLIVGVVALVVSLIAEFTGNTPNPPPPRY